MKKLESYWKRFMHTGDVTDYLNYTACAREDERTGSNAYRDEAEDSCYQDTADRYPEDDADVIGEYEVENDERDAYREWNGAIGCTDGRI